MRAAFFDAPAGVAGDMLLGSLVACGWPIERLRALAQGLGIAGLDVRAQRVRRGALMATKVDVLFGGRPVDAEREREPRHEHRHLSQVLEHLERLGPLTVPPGSWARRTFEVLAEAEAAVHGTTVGEVHFHEVGAADALVDVAGTCTGLFELGVEEVWVGPLPWSQGRVETAHGLMPIPAPATVHLLIGHPTTPSDSGREEVTPTGAALVKALCRGVAPVPGFVPQATGFGAGSHPGGPLPNAVRLTLGVVQESPDLDGILLGETNLDDVTPEIVAFALERVLEAGALDAWAVPATMKKGRSGIVLSILAAAPMRPALEAVVFSETPTLGIRWHAVDRSVLARRLTRVSTPFGDVAVKVHRGPAGEEAVAEFDAARRLALESGVPLRKIMEAASRAWLARPGGPDHGDLQGPPEASD